MAFEDLLELQNDTELDCHEINQNLFHRWASSPPPVPTTPPDLFELSNIFNDKPFNDITTQDIYHAATQWVTDYSGTPSDIIRVATLLEDVLSTTKRGGT